MRLRVDHAYTVVPDLSRAADAARALGFNVSELGVHTGRGTANHLIMLRQGYWELLGAHGDRATDAFAHVYGEPGLRGVALATQDADADGRALRASGIPVEAPRLLSRPLGPTEAGGKAAFRTATLDLGRGLDAHLFHCEHLTPDLVWREAMDVHPNGAESLAAIYLVSDHPPVTASLFQPLQDLPGPDRSSVVDIWVLTPGAFERRFPQAALPSMSRPRLAALVLAVRSLDVLRACIERSGAAAAPFADGIFVRVDALGGHVLGFEEASSGAAA